VGLTFKSELCGPFIVGNAVVGDKCRNAHGTQQLSNHLEFQELLNVEQFIHAPRAREQQNPYGEVIAGDGLVM